VRLHSRREREWTESFPDIVEAAQRLPVKNALLDGEAAVLPLNGTTSFQALQNYFSGESSAGITYFVFDLLYLDGKRSGRCRWSSGRSCSRGLTA
jgi:bifunctional non-homologous end joining protein LigD